MDAMNIANSVPMWIACGIAVCLVLAQAVIFAVKAYKAGPKIGLNKKQMNKALKSSAITSIGPSVVVLSGMLSLLITVGGPVAWMRLSMIGSVMFESIAAGIGTQNVGVTLGTDTMTPRGLGYGRVDNGSLFHRLGYFRHLFRKQNGQGSDKALGRRHRSAYRNFNGSGYRCFQCYVCASPC